MKFDTGEDNIVYYIFIIFGNTRSNYGESSVQITKFCSTENTKHVAKNYSCNLHYMLLKSKLNLCVVSVLLSWFTRNISPAIIIKSFSTRNTGIPFLLLILVRPFWFFDTLSPIWWWGIKTERRRIDCFTSIRDMLFASICVCVPSTIFHIFKAR